MTTETYRGVKIRIQKGREWGYLTPTVNGHKMGDRIGRDVEELLRCIRATIDHAIAEPDRYESCWQPGHKGKADPTCWQGHRCA